MIIEQRFPNDLSIRNLPRGKEYRCPTCLEPPPEDTQYTRNKKKYPRYYNEVKGFNGSNNYWDWDEVHYCKKCKIEYYFTNGAY